MPYSQTRTLYTGAAYLGDLADGHLAMGLGIGNVYWVIKSTEAYYSTFLADHQRTYTDGTSAVYTDIQTALDATVECRNDYVIVQPSDSDYDLTAELTLSKKNVHLIAPGGFGPVRGSTNAVRIHQTTDGQMVFRVQDASIEIAGFYVKNYAGHPAVGLAGTGNPAVAQCPNIHHNMFVCPGNAGDPVITNEIAGNTLNDGGQWGSIENNWITVYGTATIPILVNFHGHATAARFNYNDINIGDGITCVIGVNNQSTKGGVIDNNFYSGGGASGGAFTHCVQVHASGSAIGNRGTVPDGALVVGGTSTYSFSDNVNGTAAGVTDDET